jgi:hypothetical protein
VTMPASLTPSPTRSVGTRRDSMRCAASRMLSAASHQVRSRAQISPTVRPNRRASDSGAPTSHFWRSVRPTRSSIRGPRASAKKS